MFFYKTIILLLLFVFIGTITLSAQEIDINPYLKEIEKGNIITEEELQKLKEEYPNSSSLIFLEGLVSNDGEKALKIYNEFLHDFPESDYADAALFRIYSYHFSVGSYEQADITLQKLKRNFPSSPYLKLAGNKNFSIRNEEKTISDKKSYSGLSGKYTIQAGAFSNHANAINLQKNFENSGYISEIKDKNVGGTDFKVVYVGVFNTHEEAESFLSIINSRFKLSGKIIEKNW